MEQPQENNPRIATFLPLKPGQSGKICGKTMEDGSCKYTVFLDQEVIMPDPYLELVHTIMNLRETDEMTIYLCSNGGWVETGIDIIHAIQNSKGQIITHAIGMCASIAAVIWCCGKVRKISPMATLMFHMPSGGYFGKSMDVKDQTTGLCRYFTELLTRITRGILTVEDIENVVNHRKDVYLNGVTVNERLAAMEDAPTEKQRVMEVRYEA